MGAVARVVQGAAEAVGAQEALVELLAEVVGRRVVQVAVALAVLDLVLAQTQAKQRQVIMAASRAVGSL